jgi:hypothetical protein
MTECGEASSEAPAEPMTECDTGLEAKLESIRDDYDEKLARERVRAVVESYERKRANAEKQALCESIIASYKARKDAENRKAVVESTMAEKIDELGDKMTAMCEGTKGSDSLDAKFESIIAKFSKDKADAKVTKELDAKLESILRKAAASHEADKKLSAIVESVKSAADKAAPKKDALDAKLESIIANAKKKIAEAK